MALFLEYAVILLIGWASGISLYLAIALAGIGGRMGWLHLPAGLEVLEHPVVIGLAIVLYLIEFVADKVPIVDSAWDSLHTLIRPLGAAAVGFMGGTEHGPLVQTVFAMTTGAVALDMHAIKASSRVAINTSPEPVTNVVASVAEDTVVISVFWLFANHPILATLFIVLCLISSFFILRVLWRFVLKVFRRSPKAPPAPPPPSPQASS